MLKIYFISKTKKNFSDLQIVLEMLEIKLDDGLCLEQSVSRLHEFELEFLVVLGLHEFPLERLQTVCVSQVRSRPTKMCRVHIQPGLLRVLLD